MKWTSIRIYTPETRLRHPVRLLVEMLQDLAGCRDLAWRLAVRDISAKYRQAALGILWVFILPVANTTVWVFLNRSGVVHAETGMPYAVYVFSGTILWAIFSDALNAPLQQAVDARSMLIKINFPREALILSGICQTLFNAAVRIVVLGPVVMMMGVFPGWSIVLFPVAVLSLVLAGTAVGLLLTPLGLLYTDVGKSLPLLLQLLMYLSPVVFEVPDVGPARAIFEINPVTPLILTARDWLTAVPAAHAGQFVVVNVGVLMMLLVVGLLYRLAMPILIERMGS